MLEVPRSILGGNGQFSYYLLVKNLVIVKKFASVTKMASIDYERETCVTAVVVL